MPLASIVRPAGIATLEPLLGTFRSAQAVIVLVAAFVPAVTYAAARNIGVRPRAALAGAAFAGIGGGAFAPAWVTLDSFAIAAVVGTCFFMAFARAADGDVRAGALAGALVGLLFLARAEGSLFGVALLALAARPMSRRAGVAGAIVALAVGLGWLARGQLLGGSPDLLTRSALLFRYEDFFAITPTGSADLAALVTTRLGALWSDLIVALFGLFVLLAFPLFLGLRAGWRLPAVRAFAGLAILIYVAEGLIWPLHATRGSYFHSLAAFYPFAMAVVALGGETWLARRDGGGRRISGPTRRSTRAGRTSSPGLPLSAARSASIRCAPTHVAASSSASISGDRLADRAPLSRGHQLRHRRIASERRPGYLLAPRFREMDDRSRAASEDGRLLEHRDRRVVQRRRVARSAGAVRGLPRRRVRARSGSRRHLRRRGDPRAAQPVAVRRCRPLRPCGAVHRSRVPWSWRGRRARGVPAAVHRRRSSS